MKRIYLIVIIAFCYLTTNAQNQLKIEVRDSLSTSLLMGAAVKVQATNMVSLTNEMGMVALANIPNGKQVVVISFVGYQTKSFQVNFPLGNTDLVKVLLQPTAANLEEIVVSSTRTNARIEDLPMKVEVLGLEEMNEENTIKPGNIASLLGDLSVIHIQQTSATNGASVVRMQGLDGKYTQLLRDGLPLYEGFSGSFGILQIPPLDLKQIEIIKGSVSTLYGGGAIAGMINLISKKPTNTPELSFTLNRSTLKESNVNGYYAEKFGKLGLTLFGAYTHQQATDVNKDGLSDVPFISYYLIHPRLFYTFNPHANLELAYSYLTEKRNGGDLLALNGKADANHSYTEENKSQRNTFTYHYIYQLAENQQLNLKGTASIYHHLANDNHIVFSGKQQTTYNELSDLIKLKEHDIVVGLNVNSSNFKKDKQTISPLANYSDANLGFFAQDGWQLSPKLMLEVGLRADFQRRFGNFILPRVALFYKGSPNFSMRLSTGAGYKTPDVFAQDLRSNAYNQFLPITANVKAEHSTGVNYDLNYHIAFNEELSLQLNQALYYTHIENPIMVNQSGNYFELSNDQMAVNTYGTDTYVRLAYGELELYLGYNHTIAKKGMQTGNYVAYSPQDKFSSTLAYDIEGKWRFGIEQSFVANQYLYNQVKAPAYWFLAAMAEKKFKHLSVVLNCENILDSRQSKKEALFTGSLSNPQFTPLWGPIDGRVTNLSLRFTL